MDLCPLKIFVERSTSPSLSCCRGDVDRWLRCCGVSQIYPWGHSERLSLQTLDSVPLKWSPWSLLLLSLSQKKNIYGGNHYRQKYDELPEPDVFMTVTASTSGRIKFRFIRAACLVNLKGCIGLMLAKTSVMRVTIPLDLSRYSVIHSVTTFYSHSYYNVSLNTFYSVV